jgi:hypothetical protein
MWTVRRSPPSFGASSLPRQDTYVTSFFRAGWLSTAVPYRIASRVRLRIVEHLRTSPNQFVDDTTRHDADPRLPFLPLGLLYECCICHGADV